MPELEVLTVPTDELREYKNNAKLHPKEQVEQIAESIRELGFNNPILAWHNDDGEPEIAAGHGRLMAAQRLGLEEVPVIFLDHMSDEQRRAFILIDNQLAMNTGFDLETLQEELDKIESIDMDQFGFDFTLEPLVDPLKDEDIPPAFDDSRAREGDVWELGDHRLICGDSTDPDVLRRLMGDEDADLLLTDPPYNVNYVGGTEDKMTIANDNFASSDDYMQFLIAAFDAASRVMKDGAPFYIWLAASEYISNITAAEKAGLEVHQVLAWVKDRFTLGRQDYQNQYEPCLYGWKSGAGHWFAPTHKETSVLDDEVDPSKMKKDELVELVRKIQAEYESDVMREPKPSKNDLHPTMKPVRLFERMMRNSSRSDAVVLDPFGGSGTTIVACEKMGRRARVVELDPHYCDVIIERWEEISGKEAVLVSEEGDDGR